MAYNDSGELSPSQSYQLGGYTFVLRSNYDGDEEVTGIVARMTYNGETKVQGIDIDGQATIESWSVEANESTADVYVIVSVVEGIPIPGKKTPVPSGDTADVSYDTGNSLHFQFYEGRGKITCAQASIGHESYSLIAASDSPGAVAGHPNWHYPLNRTYEYRGKTVYWTPMQPHPGGMHTITSASPAYDDTLDGAAAWMMIYGPGERKRKEKLVARFEIDLETADGGPDGDWDEPGDSGDPSYTLNLSVTGATAGTHDALVFPSDNTAEKGYGCGGDGGHGGGGGAGASTVIIYEFATSKAGNVNQEAYTREPGVGSGGGKGGKGGDGCILIFY